MLVLVLVNTFIQRLSIETVSGPEERILLCTNI